MSSLSVSRMNFGDNLINQSIATKSNTTVQKSENKDFDNEKIVMGLGALSIAILGGLLVHKSIKLNKLLGKVKQLEETITKNNTLQEQLSNAETKLADSKRIIEELNEKINNLPQNIKLHETKEGRYILGGIHNFVKNPDTPEALKKDMIDLLKIKGYTFVEYNTKDFEKYKFQNKEDIMNKCFDFYEGYAEKTTVPALIYPYPTIDSEMSIIIKGIHIYPRD